MIKLLLCIDIKNDWIVRHFDLQNAFPNEKLERDVNAKLPRYVHREEMGSNTMMKLLRTLYGLKDAS